jgi:hypothetical protein
MVRSVGQPTKSVPGDLSAGRKPRHAHGGERIVDAVEAFGGSTFPLVTREKGPVLDVARHNVFVEGPLDGHVVEGPPVDNVYGPSFAKAARTVDGPIRLETQPEGPLAIVREEAGFVGCTVLHHF